MLIFYQSFLGVRNHDYLENSFFIFFLIFFFLWKNRKVEGQKSIGKKITKKTKQKLEPSNMALQFVQELRDKSGHNLCYSSSVDGWENAKLSQLTNIFF